MIEERHLFKPIHIYTAVILLLLFSIGTIYHILSVIALCVCAYIVLRCDLEKSLCLLCFTMPFATIFKYSPSSQSFFTYVFLLLIIRLLIQKELSNKKISINSVISIIFILFCFTIQMAYNCVDVATLIKIWMLLMLLNLVSDYDFENGFTSIVYSYIFGIILSSLLCFWGGSIFPLYQYAPVKDLSITLNGVRTSLDRFSGLYSDPNYYSTNLIISLLSIVILYSREEIKKIYALSLSSCLLFFVIMTYSKSSFLMLLLPVILLIFVNHTKKKYTFQLITFVGLSLVVIFMFLGRISALNTIFLRFTTEGEGVNSLTTGRTSIWMNYFEYFASNPIPLFFGNGLKAPPLNRVVPHNTYIDTIYYLGLFGGFIFYWLIISSFRSKKISIKRNFANYSIVICVLVMYFFLSELLYFDLPIHLLIAMGVYNMSFIRIKKGNN